MERIIYNNEELKNFFASLNENFRTIELKNERNFVLAEELFKKPNVGYFKLLKMTDRDNFYFMNKSKDDCEIILVDYKNLGALIRITPVDMKDLNEQIFDYVRYNYQNKNINLLNEINKILDYSDSKFNRYSLIKIKSDVYEKIKDKLNELIEKNTYNNFMMFKKKSIKIKCNNIFYILFERDKKNNFSEINDFCQKNDAIHIIKHIKVPIPYTNYFGKKVEIVD